MTGAIIGDIVGSRFEFNSHKPDYDFDLFTNENVYTDDTVLTVAVADKILNNGSYVKNLKQFSKKYPKAGYGRYFSRWVLSESNEPYNSYGNGSAMRVSPVGWAYNTIDEVFEEAKKSAEVTHNHKEGIKGAQAVAVSIYLARIGKSKDEIKQFIEETFRYKLNYKIEELRKKYIFDESCQGTVPQSISVFLQSSDFEDAIRNAIYIGGDSDTIGAIVGSIAHAFYKDIPEEIKKETFERLPTHLLLIVKEFCEKYNVPGIKDLWIA